MGQLTRVRQTLLAMFILACLPGCTAALTSAASMPSSLVVMVADQFVGQEVSVADSMRRMIAAIQLVLQSMKLDIDTLEIQKDGGYMIGFGNDKLTGTISLSKQTERLSTMDIKVWSNMREKSVESAIIDLVKKKLNTLPDNAQFKKAQYRDLMNKPSMASILIGWFRIGAKLTAEQSNKQGWLKIKLSSGNTAYLKGSIVK